MMQKTTPFTLPEVRVLENAGMKGIPSWDVFDPLSAESPEIVSGCEGKP
jgi:hypothetical protein